MTGQQDESPEVEPGTEVAVQQSAPTAAVAPVGAEHGSEGLLQFVRDLQLAYQAAQMLVTTSFVPQSYSGKPSEAAAAIVTGQGLGLDPLASLRSMDVISGTPAFRAITIRALVQSHGHEIWVEEQNQQRAIVKGRRKGTDKVETSMWDMDRARRLNLTNKPNWKNQPEAMLVARATTEVGRLIAADALLGMAYSIEELEDGVTPEAQPPAEPQPRRTRTVSRKGRSEAAAPAEQDDAPVSPTEPEEADAAEKAQCQLCGDFDVLLPSGLCADCDAEVKREEAAG